MLRFLMILILSATTGFAQTPGGVQPYHRVGDTLRYTVVFDGDANFSSVVLDLSDVRCPCPTTWIRFEFQHQPNSEARARQVRGGGRNP